MIEGKTISEVVRKSVVELRKNGIYVGRVVGDWCMQNIPKSRMLELQNVTLVLTNPKMIWNNFVNTGVMTEFLDIMLASNPGNLHKVWKFYENWQGKDGKYPYTYGERIFGDYKTDRIVVNQFMEVVTRLQADPTSRQANIVIRRPYDHHNVYTPCTVGYHFQMDNENELNMTAIMRSNDIMKGGLPRNIWLNCMFFNQVCIATNLAMGKYYHFDINLHVYAKDEQNLSDLLRMVDCPFPNSQTDLGSLNTELLGGTIDKIFRTQNSWELLLPMELHRSSVFWESYIAYIALKYTKRPYFLDYIQTPEIKWLYLEQERERAATYVAQKGTN